MDRRDFLARIPAAAAAAQILAPSSSAQTRRAASSLKVRSLETFTVQVNARGNWLLVRLDTGEGLTGIGEASHGSAFGNETGNDATTRRYLNLFMERLKGRSIFDIEWLRAAAFQETETGGLSAACALSALEQCLWDLIGQALDVPVYDLFGGALTTSIRNYANINRSTDPRTPAGFAAMARKAVDFGFDAVKLAPWDDMPRDLSDSAKVEAVTRLGNDRALAVREVLGPRRDLLLDAHSKFDVERGLKLIDRVAPLNLFWLEEVTPVPGLPAIHNARKMPMAGGELIYGSRGFYPYLQAGSVDIAMPDVKYCGGMLELKKVGSLAEAAGLRVSPHGPAGPVGNRAAAHVCAGMPNFLILEFSFGEVPWRAELIEPAEELVKGHIRLTDRPGLGIRLNDKTAARYKV